MNFCSGADGKEAKRRKKRRGECGGRVRREGGKKEDKLVIDV